MLVITIVLVLLSFCGHAFAGKSVKPIALGSPSTINGQNEQQVCLNMLHGTLVRTDNPLDLAIEGEGYIVLNNGQQDLYSRGRSLGIDENWMLVDPNTGYCIQRIGSAGEDDGFQIPGDGNIYLSYDMSLPGRATSRIVVWKNLSTDQTFPVSQTQVLRSNIMYTVNGFAALVNTKIVDLDQFSGTPMDSKIYVTGIKPDGTAVSDSTGMSVTATTTLGDLLTYIDGKLGADNVTASMVNGRIHITDYSPGYSRTDIALFYDSLGTDFLTMPSYFEIVTVGGEHVRDITIIFYDSQGDTHVLNAAFVRADMPNTWDLVLTSIDSRPSFTQNVTISSVIQKNEGISLLEPLPKLQPLPIDPPPPSLSLPIDPNRIKPWRSGLIALKAPVSVDNIHEITFDGRRIEGIEFNSDDGSYAGLNTAIGDTAEFVITFAHDTSNPQTIAIDMGTLDEYDGLTQFATGALGTSTAVAREENGYGPGNLSSISVENNGTIVGIFSNGIKRDIATIQMAMFDNVCGLESIGSGYFLSSDESGDAIATQATSNGAGAIHDKYLEQPVELAEFVREKIWRAVNNKKSVLWVFELAFDKEWLANVALEIMLESGDYGDLSKPDIVKAKQRILSAMQQQKQSLDALKKSIENLEEVLTVLGVEPLADGMSEE